jgi:hypothetical protein
MLRSKWPLLLALLIAPVASAQGTAKKVGGHNSRAALCERVVKAQYTDPEDLKRRIPATVIEKCRKSTDPADLVALRCYDAGGEDVYKCPMEPLSTWRTDALMASWKADKEKIPLCERAAGSVAVMVAFGSEKDSDKAIAKAQKLSVAMTKICADNKDDVKNKAAVQCYADAKLDDDKKCPDEPGESWAKAAGADLK